MKTTTNGYFDQSYFTVRQFMHAFDLDQSKPVVSVARKSILSCQVLLNLKCKQKQGSNSICDISFILSYLPINDCALKPTLLISMLTMSFCAYNANFNA